MAARPLVALTAILILALTACEGRSDRSPGESRRSDAGPAEATPLPRVLLPTAPSPDRPATPGLGRPQSDHPLKDASADPARSPAAPLSEPPTDLKPGARLILKFPELPQTLHAMQSGKEAATQCYVALPENYSAEGEFPLFVFLYGGHGGPGAGPGRGHEIMGGRDCIFVNLPLFKKMIDPNGPFKGLMITTEQDGEVICQAYATMLKKLYQTIPNIDTRRNIIGGMSNGANSIVAIFERGDPYLTECFQSLILIEGGVFSIRSYDRYQGKSILYLYGDYVGQVDWLGKKMRAELPQAVRKFEDAATSHHLQATGLVMPNTGHDMPARFNPAVKDWVVKQLAR